MNFKDFKKNKGQLKSAIETVADKKKTKSNFYFPKLDSEGNGYAVLRILPQKSVEKIAYETIVKHKHKQGQQWVNLLCPTSVGKKYDDCPLCGIYSEEWNRRHNAGEEKPSIDTRRCKSWVMNVLVVEDADQPEKVGKVFPMYATRTIIDMIDAKIFPKARGKKPADPIEVVYDLFEGRNLELVIFKNKKNWSDYSESKWSAELTPVASTDKEIEEIYNQIEDLSEKYNNESMLVSPEEMVAKWNAYMAKIGNKTIEQQSKEIEKIKTEKLEDAKKEEKHEESFSMNDVGSNDVEDQNEDNDDDDDAPPW